MPTKNIFGFSDRNIAVDLMNFVTSGEINKVPKDVVSLPETMIPAARI